MKKTKQPSQEPAPFSRPRPLAQSDIESLQKEMRQDLTKMQDYLESSGIAEQLRRHLKEN